MKRFLGATFGIVLALLLAMSVALADDGDKKSGAFTYQLKGNGTAVITGYEGANEDVYVPRMVDGYTVTEIGENAFSSVGKYIITLPDTITVIGDRAFEECRASVINIPDSVQSIGDFAFQSCSNIQTVSIPASVERIGTGAFAYCSSVKEFYVDSENAVYATIDGVLFNKQKKELVFFPLNKESNQYSVPAGIESVGAYAFADAGEININLTNSIKTIGDYAFEKVEFLHEEDNQKGSLNRKPTIIKLPYSLEYIGSHAFDGADLGYVEIGSNLKYIGDYAFQSAKLFNYYEEGSGIFSSTIRSIVLPSSVQEIGEWAFCKVEAEDFLNEIDLSKTQIKVLKAGTFADVDMRWSTTYIILPETLKEIETAAFIGVRVGRIIMDSVEIIGENVFDGSTIYISVGNNLKEIGDRAFDGHRFNSQTNFILPDTVTTIGAKAFANTKSLETLTIPASVERIGEDLCNKANVVLEVEKGSYAERYALENGYQIKREENADTSWLNN